MTVEPGEKEKSSFNSSFPRHTDEVPDPPLAGDPRLASKEIYEKTPVDFPGGNALRESFLLQLPDDVANGLRSFLEILFRDYQEAGMTETRSYGGSILKGELLAASRDLRHLARFLSLAAYNMIDEATPSERPLVEIADRLAVQLYEAAEMISNRVLRKGKPRPADPEALQPPGSNSDLEPGTVEET
jgi:hypothetical protein